LASLAMTVGNRAVMRSRCGKFAPSIMAGRNIRMESDGVLADKVIKLQLRNPGYSDASKAQLGTTLHKEVLKWPCSRTRIQPE